VSGAGYARAIGQANAAMEKVRLDMAQPTSEVEHLFSRLEQSVLGLFEDQRLLADRLDMALRPSLLEKQEAGTRAADSPIPSSRLGRRLLELVEQVGRLRVESSDLAARVAL